jgi:ATP-dependent helicase HrpA
VVERVQQAYAQLLHDLPPDRRSAEPVRDIRWMIEELQVSLFAQALGPAQPVSEQRIGRAMASVAEA